MSISERDLVLALCTILLSVIAFETVRIRNDVRYVRDKVLILWEWYENNIGLPNGNERTTYKHEPKP